MWESDASVRMRMYTSTKRKLTTRLATFFAAVATWMCIPTWALHTQKQLAPGVTLIQEVSVDADKPLIVNALVVDPAAAGVDVKAALAQDVVMTDDWRKGRETVSKLTARKGALAGFNADYFPFTGDPLSVCIVDGELISEPQRNRAALAILSNKGVFFDNPRFSGAIRLARGVQRQIDGINRVRETNQLVVYTEAFGVSTQNQHKGTDVVCVSDDLPVRVGKTLSLNVKQVLTNAVNTPIPKGGVVLSAGGPAAYFLSSNVKPGDILTAEFGIKSSSCYEWSLVEQAVGGGPWLVKDSKPFIDAAEEGWGPQFVNARHPRTAVGVTADKKLIIVTVDGRQFISAGISLTDLAALMIRLGCVEAINLDGGGSTTFSVKGLLINSVSDGEERPVATALLVFAVPDPSDQLPNLAICGVEPNVVSGQGMQLSLVFGDDAKPLPPEQCAKVIWGTTNGIGFVNQMGYFTPVKLRQGTVNAIYGSQVVSVPVNVIGGPPYKIEMSVLPDKQDALESRLLVKVLDEKGNPLPGQEVLVTVMGGAAESQNGVTNEKGEFVVGIVWDSSSTAKAASAASGGVVASIEVPASK